MTIRQFVNRSIIRTLLLTALLPLATANAAQTADGFWGHRIGLQVDVAYGENPAQVFDLYLYGQRTGEPDYFCNRQRPTTYLGVDPWRRLDRRR